jgi:hypothetical protein
MKFFHRYQSSIHGNYRKAYLRCGVVAGVMLMLYIVVRYLLGVPAESPEAYITDGILLLALFLFAFQYRGSLPEGKVTLKELMLFGIGTTVVASVLYGLFIWIFGSLAADQTVLFTRTLSGKEIPTFDPELRYWAALWGIVSGVKLMVLGGFGAFLSALLFRNEKSEIKNK